MANESDLFIPGSEAIPDPSTKQYSPLGKADKLYLAKNIMKRASVDGSMSQEHLMILWQNIINMAIS
ncbi:MAG: hypothetical protein WCL07_03820 [bacterium]